MTNLAQVIYCWEDGPVDPVTDIGSTCLLPDGHSQPCEWTDDADIAVAFTAPECHVCHGDLGELKVSEYVTGAHVLCATLTPEEWKVVVRAAIGEVRASGWT